MRSRLVLLALAAAVLAPAPAGAAPPSDASQEGSVLARLATAPRSGQGLAILSREVRRGGAASLDLYGRALSRRGLPTGPEHLIATESRPHLGFGGGEQIAVAADGRRDRFLVAWSGFEAGMAAEPCPASPGPPGLAPQPCERRDQEIFVRLVGADGAPLGPARRVTTTGPAERPELQSVTPSLAYDRRTDSHLLVYAGITRGDGFRGELFAQRLGAEGEPIGSVRRLDLRPGADSAAPLARLAPDPGGGHLFAFTWGAKPNRAELYTTRLDARGRPGRIRSISKRGGPGAGGLELAADPGARAALVIWADARVGASSGFRARRLRRDGRPAGRAVALPFAQGNGAVVASPDTSGAGWLYAFAREDEAGCEICRRVAVRRARRDGRVTGRARDLSPSGVNAAGPLLAPLSRGAHVLGWFEPPTQVGPGGPSAPRSRVRTVR